MLHSITSTLPNFAKIKFTEGVNFIVAKGDTTRDRKGTANSVGKSSVFALVDYLLGGSASGGDFNLDEFAGVSFTLDATLGGARVEVTRATAQKERGKVRINGDVSAWKDFLTPPQIAAAQTTGLELKINSWKNILGRVLFDIPATVPRSVAKQASPPSARELLGLLNRKAFNHVVKAFAGQGEEKGTLAAAYLMGLNWSYLATLLGLKKEDEIAKSIKVTANFKMEGFKQDKAAALRQFKKLEAQVAKAEKELSQFKAKETIDLFLCRADEVTAQLRQAQMRATNASRRIALAKKSMAGMEEDPNELVALYNDAKVTLGDAVKASLEEARHFHEQLRAYRVNILKKEIAFYSQELNDANATIERLDKERATWINDQNNDIRDTFRDFNEKQQQLASLRRQLAEFEQVQELMDDAQREEDRLNKVRLDFAAKEKDIFVELAERIAAFGKAFRDEITALYGEDATPKFAVEFYDGERPLGKKKPFTMKIVASFQGDKGPGKAHVKVCVFDLLMLSECRRQDMKIDFLMHDSPAFESTDGNQFPGVMLFAEKMTQTNNFQYICAIDETRFDLARKSNADFQRLADGAQIVRLSQEHKLYGFDF